MRIPLFPLNIVMFPGMAMPLHIFEPRYRLMVKRCLQARMPFGIVLQGIAEWDDDPAQVGTMAIISNVEPLSDGCMNITATGSGRFRIQRVFHDQPYLEAEVEAFPLAPADEEEIKPLVAYLQPRIASYLDLLNSDKHVHFEASDMPDDPIDLAYLIAIVLQLPLADKQALLQMNDALDLLNCERAMLPKEHSLLRFMVQTARAQRQLEAGPTGRLFLN